MTPPAHRLSVAPMMGCIAFAFLLALPLSASLADPLPNLVEVLVD